MIDTNHKMLHQVMLNLNYEAAFLFLKAPLDSESVCKGAGGKDGINMHEPPKVKK